MAAAVEFLGRLIRCRPIRFFLLSGPIVLCVLSAYKPYLNLDVAQYLSIGQMIIDGTVPYVDIVDTNPPMIMYISAIPAAASRFSGESLASCGLCFFVGLILCLGWSFTRALQLTDSTFTDNQAWLFWASLAWVAVWVYIGGDFAQRDQLAFLFWAPFCVVRKARYEGKEQRTGVVSAYALMAAIGLAMKPQYLLVLVFTEVLFSVAYRRFWRIIIRVEVFVLVASGLLYLAHFYFVPGMSQFYEYWLPIISRGYSAYNASWSRMVEKLIEPSNLIWMAGLFCLCSLPFWRIPRLLLPCTFGWIALASLMVFVFQMKGWNYHRVPVYYAVVTGFGLLSREVLRGDCRERLFSGLRRVAFLAVAIPVLMCTSTIRMLATFEGKRSGYPSHVTSARRWTFPKNDLTVTIERLTGPDDRVLFVSTNVGPASPALAYTGRMHAGRFLCAFPLAFFFHDSSEYDVPAPWKAEEEAFYGGLVDDVGIFRPPLVFIWGAPRGPALPSYFRIGQYLERRGFFRTAMQGYSCIGSVDGFDVYLRAERRGALSEGLYRDGVLVPPPDTESSVCQPR